MDVLEIGLSSTRRYLPKSTLLVSTCNVGKVDLYLYRYLFHLYRLHLRQFKAIENTLNRFGLHKREIKIVIVITPSCTVNHS